MQYLAQVLQRPDGGLHAQHCNSHVESLTGGCTVCRVFGQTVSAAKYLQKFSGPGHIVASSQFVKCAAGLILLSILT